MPTSMMGRRALIGSVVFFLMWIGIYALEAWARMPVSTLSTKLTVMISYTYVTIALGIINGIIAGIARFRHGDTAKVLWLPIAIAAILVGAVVRSLLFT